MKTPTSPRVVALMILGAVSPVFAQNLPSIPASAETSLKAASAPGTFEIPSLKKAEGDLSDDPAVFASQDAGTLNEQASASREVDTVVDLDILRNPSPYRKVLVSANTTPYDIEGGSLQSGLAQISAVYRESGTPEKTSDCLAVSLSVEQRVKLDTSKVLEIVEAEVTANPGCSCEVVKTAIKASEADVDQVVAIVEAAIHASPESMRIVSQCAIAASPESVVAIQALLTRLDPNAGETGYSSKSAKSAKDAKDSKVASIIAPPLPNPLDLPPPLPPFPPITPRPVTDVDPSSDYSL